MTVPGAAVAYEPVRYEPALAWSQDADTVPAQRPDTEQVGAGASAVVSFVVAFLLTALTGRRHPIAVGLGVGLANHAHRQRQRGITGT
jgi:hypothetical protein